MGSAFKNKGVQVLLDGVNQYLPSPGDVKNIALDVTATHGTGKTNPDLESEVELDSTNLKVNPFIGFAFKIQDHPTYGVLTYMRVYQGVLKKGEAVYDVQSEKKITPKRLLRMHS